jgi:hypothetical protein
VLYSEFVMANQIAMQFASVLKKQIATKKQIAMAN